MSDRRHVYPLNDVREHWTDGRPCWCSPTLKDGVVMHNQVSAVLECSEHPNCQGPTLIPNHATECPDGNGDDCDNDTCWVPCAYCIDPDAVTKH